MLVAARAFEIAIPVFVPAIPAVRRDRACTLETQGRRAGPRAFMVCPAPSRSLPRGLKISASPGANRDFRSAVFVNRRFDKRPAAAHARHAGRVHFHLRLTGAQHAQQSPCRPPPVSGNSSYPCQRIALPNSGRRGASWRQSNCTSAREEEPVRMAVVGHDRRIDSGCHHLARIPAAHRNFSIDHTDARYCPPRFVLRRRAASAESGPRAEGDRADLCKQQCCRARSCSASARRIRFIAADFTSKRH